MPAKVSVPKWSVTAKHDINCFSCKFKVAQLHEAYNHIDFCRPVQRSCLVCRRYEPQEEKMKVHIAVKHFGLSPEAASIIPTPLSLPISPDPLPTDQLIMVTHDGLPIVIPTSERTSPGKPESASGGRKRASDEEIIMTTCDGQTVRIKQIKSGKIFL